MEAWEKLVYAAGLVMLALILAFTFAYWLSNQVPSRPRTVAADAVFLWAPRVGLPAPRRGWWLSCAERSGHIYCKKSDIDGRTEYEGEFVPCSRSAVPARQFQIDAEESREHSVWVGEALVPLVKLQNGATLVPANTYEQACGLLNQQ